MSDGVVLVVGGTSGIGHEVARHYAEAGQEVIITGRDSERARTKAAEIGESVSGLGFDLTQPDSIAAALSDVGDVAKVVITAVLRDSNPIKEYNISTARDLITMKMLGYTETIHALIPRLSDDSAVVLYGGLAKERPYPGAITVATVNGGVATMINDLAIELAPIRFNAIHPGIVGDSWFWEDKDLSNFVARTPTGKLATTAQVVDATVFLLENKAINGVNLYVDGGWMLM
ncbi:MAG TPA: SDR family oxidoreductase [Acidimicrobiia bacterium]|nr:SDR family oxidoreductase [Acidimicrobiia bacterium]